jgi:Mce-associated membrane protein
VTAEESSPIEDVDAPQAVPPRQRLAGKLVPALWIVLVVASVSLLAVLFYAQYRPDREMKDDAAKAAAMDAAKNGAVAVLTYSSDTFDRDVSSARSHLTGDFLSQYDQYIQSAVAPVARAKAVKTTATVVKTAVSALRPNSADVLLYINQATTTAGNPAPSMAASSVMVKLTKVDGTWLISSFNPV